MVAHTVPALELSPKCSPSSGAFKTKVAGYSFIYNTYLEVMSTEINGRMTSSASRAVHLVSDLNHASLSRLQAPLKSKKVILFISAN